MDLISRDKAQEIIPKVVLGVSDFAECIRDSVNTVFDNCPSAFEGKTNGEVLIILFPELKYYIMNDRVMTTIGVAASFGLEWWNAPYKEECEE